MNGGRKKTTTGRLILLCGLRCYYRLVVYKPSLMYLCISSHLRADAQYSRSTNNTQQVYDSYEKHPVMQRMTKAPLSERQCANIPGVVLQCVDQKLMEIYACGVCVFLTGVWVRKRKGTK